MLSTAHSLSYSFLTIILRGKHKHYLLSSSYRLRKLEFKKIKKLLQYPNLLKNKAKIQTSSSSNIEDLSLKQYVFFLPYILLRFEITEHPHFLNNLQIAPSSFPGGARYLACWWVRLLTSLSKSAVLIWNNLDISFFSWSFQLGCKGTHIWNQ